MQAGIRYIEPGTLPKRVRFYAQRRELAGMGSLRAFTIGLALGVTAIAAAGLIIYLLK